MSNETKRTNVDMPVIRLGGRRGPGGPPGMQQVEKAKDRKKRCGGYFIILPQKKRWWQC